MIYITILFVFIFIYVLAVLYMKDAVQALIVVAFINTFLPQYLSFGPIKYTTLFNFISLFFVVKYLFVNKNDFLSNKIIKLETSYIFILLLFAVLSGTIFLERQVSYLRTTVANFAVYAFIFIYLFRKNSGNILRFYKFISVFIFLLTLYGIYCYATSSNIIMSVLTLFFNPRDYILEQFSTELRGGLQGRIQGLTTHPLEYAGQMLTAFFLMLHYMFDIKRKYTPFLLFLLILITVNMFFTGSRSGLIGFIIGCFLWIYLFGNLSVKGKIVLTTSFIAAYFLTSSVLMADYGDYINSVLYFWESSSSVHGSSFELRLTQLEGAFNIIDDDTTSFLFGIGADWVRQYSMSHNGLHPVLLGFESIVFIGLIEFGIIGLFVVTFGLFFMLYKFSKRSHTSMTCTILIISFFIFQLFTGNYSFSVFVCSLMIMAKDSALRYKLDI